MRKVLKMRFLTPEQGSSDTAKEIDCVTEGEGAEDLKESGNRSVPQRSRLGSPGQEVSALVQPAMSPTCPKPGQRR